jgi:hypothetical protein
MSWVEYRDWYHFYLLEPFGDAKEDWYRSQMLFATLKNTFPEAEVSLAENCRYSELPLSVTSNDDDEPISDEELKRKIKNMGR